MDIEGEPTARVKVNRGDPQPGHLETSVWDVPWSIGGPLPIEDQAADFGLR